MTINACNAPEWETCLDRLSGKNVWESPFKSQQSFVPLLRQFVQVISALLQGPVGTLCRCRPTLSCSERLLINALSICQLSHVARPHTLIPFETCMELGIGGHMSCSPQTLSLPLPPVLQGKLLPCCEQAPRTPGNPPSPPPPSPAFTPSLQAVTFTSKVLLMVGHCLCSITKFW